MAFFQNVFTSDFEGNWVLDDRQYVPKFTAKPNAGRGDELAIAWNKGPYDLSGNDADGTSSDTLEIVFALNDSKNWATLAIDITSEAASTAAVTPEEIAASLNADTGFTERFKVSVEEWGDNSSAKRVKITQKQPIVTMRFYINNGRAEEKIRFNGRAGVGELPTYFDRHTIANRFNFEDSQNHLIFLDIENSNVDLAIVNDAVNYNGTPTEFGWDGTTAREDWELLEGRSGLFNFVVGDGTADSTSTKIYYPAGAKAGDLAKKVITIVDTGGDIVQQMELPYTLESGDLITPP